MNTPKDTKELHLDFLEQAIEVGDEVITIPPRSCNSGMHRLMSATIMHFTPQGVRVQYKDGRGKMRNTVVLCSETVFMSAAKDTTREVIAGGSYVRGQWIPPVYKQPEKK